MSKSSFSERLMIVANQNIKEKTYWLEKLSGNVDKSVIPYDYIHSNWIEKSIYENELSSKIIDKLMKISKGSKDGLHMILITGLFVLLSKRELGKHALIGTPVYKVDKDDDLINTVLPIQGVVDDNQSFKELLMTIKDTISEADNNQNYPMKILAEQIDFESKNGFFPLFEIALMVEGIHNLNYFNEIDLNLIFSFDFKEQNPTVKIIYNQNCYHLDTVKYLEVAFFRILEEMLYNPNKKISELDMITEEEKHQLLFEFNNTKKIFPDNKSVHELFEEQVIKQWDNIALLHEDNSITYSELNVRSNHIAQLLIAKGIKKNDVVAIACSRSIEMVVSIFGILKSGACYLPLDITFPRERLEYILNDSRANILLTNINDESISLFNGEVINVNNTWNFNENILNNLVPCDLAYIIYTSGSTGNPKGVMIEHQSVVNLLYSLQELYPIKKYDSYLFKTSYCFDVSISELFGWIIGGGKMVILPNEAEKDPIQIIDCIFKEKTDFINFVPSMFSYFISTLNEKNKRKIKSLKYIFLAGEELKSKIVDDFNKLELEISLQNLYGPTEATVYVSNYHVNELHGQNLRVPIGKPLANVEYYILAEGTSIQPIGTVGELYISGKSISRGYINQVELTHEKFVVNRHINNQLLYKTGDLARWLPNGTVEFFGRIDNQVKIRGFRIELGEIEKVLLKHEDVRDSVVIKKEIKGEGYLCAYVIVSNNHDDIAQILRNYLVELLPSYMIPSYIVVVDHFPTTSSGKLNKRELPLPDTNPGNKYLPPTNEIEGKIVQMWSEILNLSVEKISITANFFELGGHSLRATIFLNRLYEELNMKLNLVDFFNIPIIKDISEMLLVTEDEDIGGEHEEYEEISI